MIASNLGAQYLQSALATWRQANPWASHITFDQFPQKYKDEIEVAATLLAGGEITCTVTHVS
jgi:hypothetical protein